MACIHETLKLLRASLPSTIEIIQDIRVNKGMVLADPTQVQQVLMNLCVNAGHAMQDEGGLLEVVLSEEELDEKSSSLYTELKPGPHLMLSVRDTGHGMPNEVLGRIYDPFFTTKDPGQGSGLGLYMVQGIIKNHDGAIRVSSIPGSGTVFRVLLPRLDEAPNFQKETDPEDFAGKARVLFVDDEKQLAALGRMQLE